MSIASEDDPPIPDDDDIPFRIASGDDGSWGVFSDCSEHIGSCRSPTCLGRLYRYLLAIPTGVPGSRSATGIFANPSTAVPGDLDPTVTRWVNYCRSWSYSWAWVVNVRSWRETNPKKVPADPLAIGSNTDEFIERAVTSSDLVVCGWGKLGGARGAEVLALIRKLGVTPHALKLNKDGSPAHPLYLRADLKPFQMETETT